MQHLIEMIKNVLNSRKQRTRVKSAFDFEARRDLTAESRKIDDQLAQIREEQTKRFSQTAPPEPTAQTAGQGYCIVS